MKSISNIGYFGATFPVVPGAIIPYSVGAGGYGEGSASNGSNGSQSNRNGGVIS